MKDTIRALRNSSSTLSHTGPLPVKKYRKVFKNNQGEWACTGCCYGNKNYNILKSNVIFIYHHHEKLVWNYSM